MPRTRNPEHTAQLRRGEHQWIRATRLLVDPSYERPLSDVKVRKIVNGFDPDAIGVLYVSKRADGSYVILDGMHRHAAIVEMGWAEQSVPCYVYAGLSLADEARLFREFNELRTRPRPIDLHRAAVVANDERAVRIEKVLHDLGLQFAEAIGLAHVASVQSCQIIYDQAGERTLKETLGICTRAWGEESTSYNGEVMVGIAAIIARHGRALDRDRLVRVLHKLDPKLLLTRARVIKAELGTSGSNSARSASVIASLVVTAYNFRLAEKARLSWDMTCTGRAFWKATTREQT